MPQKQTSQRTIALIALAMTFVFQIFSWQLYAEAPQMVFYGDTDNAMRAVQVKDLLSGQSWWDTTQTRMNPPHGGGIHWSRVVDAPIAASLWLTQSLWGEGQTADMVAFSLWPALMVFCFYMIGLNVAARLSHINLIAACAALLFFPHLTQKFNPFDLDHHNIQIVLMCLAILGVSWGSKQGARLCGAALGVSLAIGFETLAYVAAIIIFELLVWVFEGQKRKYHTLNLLWSVILAMGVCFITTTHPTNYAVTNSCDALSLATLTLAILGAALWTLAQTQWTTRTRLTRALLLASIGIIVLISHMDYAKSCITGPYSTMSPYLIENFINKITEVKSAWYYLTNETPLQYIIMLSCWYAFLSISICCYDAHKHKSKTALLLWVLTALALALSFLQVRATIYVYAFAAFAMIRLLNAAYRDWPNQSGVKALALVLAIPVFALGLIMVFISNSGTESKNSATENTKTALETVCGESELKVLNALKPQKILSDVSIGAFILAHTHHSVHTAPYHRNAREIEEIVRLFNANEEDAKQRLNAMNADVLLVCATSQTPSFSEHNTSFLRNLAEGKTAPEWLTPVDLEGLTALKLYRISRPSSVQK